MDQKIMMDNMLKSIDKHHDRAYGYADTVRRIRGVFSPDDTFISFFEEVFSDSELERLCLILGVKYHSVDFTKKVNESDPKVQLSKDELKILTNKYKNVYLDMAKLFGNEKISQVWPLSKDILKSPSDNLNRVG